MLTPCCFLPPGHSDDSGKRNSCTISRAASSHPLHLQDECHHARGKSAYAQIMDEYHRCKRDSDFALPQILGLTASPLFNPDNPEQAFKKLEEKLDSVIVSVRDSKIEAEGYTWKPIEKPLYYSETGHHVAQTDIELMLHELEIWDMVDADKVMNRINDTKRVGASNRMPGPRSLLMTLLCLGPGSSGMRCVHHELARLAL